MVAGYPPIRERNAQAVKACLQLDRVKASVAVQFVTFAAGKSDERKLTFLKQIIRRRFDRRPFVRVAIEGKLKALPLQLNEKLQRRLLLPDPLPRDTGTPLKLSAP